MLDILHQLLKGVVGSMHMLQWLKTIIGAKFKGACVKANITKSLQQANEMYCWINVFAQCLLIQL